MTTSHAAAVPEAGLPPLTDGPHRKRIGLISIVACLGGLLFGYDTGVSNGAEGPMDKELGLSLLQLGVVISSLIFAAAVGALIGGQISDRIGRRKTIIVLAVMFFVVGQFAAFVVNAILGNTLGDHVEGVWRIMFGICALPAVALFVGMLRMPESPRWLVEKGRDDEALAVLKTVRSEDRALAELAQVEQVTEDEKKGNRLGFKEILANKWLRRIVFVGIGVSMTQQLTGINSIMYYGSRVLEESGFTETAATLGNTLFGLAAVVGGIIALYNMDRLDRRKTFFIGLAATTTCHLLVGVASLIIPEGAAIRPYVILVLITAFVLSMQSFLNVAVWVWLAEIFPLQIRGLAIGVAVFFGWFVNGLLALYVPSLLAALGMGTFFLFAIIGVIMLGFLWHEVPETRGRSLEHLEDELLDGSIYQSLPRRLPFAGVLYDRRR